MAENDQNLGGNVNVADLSSLPVDGASLSDASIDAAAESMMGDDQLGGIIDINQEDIYQGQKSINGDVFLDVGDEGNPKANSLNKESDIGKYVRLTFISGIFIIIGILFLALAYSFNLYIKQASKPVVDAKYQSYVREYRTYLGKIKDLVGYNNISNYQKPNSGGELAKNTVSTIINATDIDYIDKKEILSDYVSSLSTDIKNDMGYMGTLKERIARQGFLPNELEDLLSEDQAIDTIQRSLNALEIIKFSTATKVFSYMNTALITISEMIRMKGANVDSIKQLFEQLNGKGEKDIASYVYMCYLNPFETNANCDRIGDLDLYYGNAEDNSIDIKLFKNTMNAISQLLEKEDTTLFSITFNGFDAQAKNISFSIEVYTNQEDERVLLAQGKRNPNIFILTNIINLLKQSSFIIGADINTKEMNIDTRTVDWGGITRTVNYSSMDFSVPIQKNTEREIFDYIDLESVKKLLTDRGLEGIESNETAKGQDDEKIEEIIEGDEEIIEGDEEIIEGDEEMIEGDEEMIEGDEEMIEERDV